MARLKKLTADEEKLLLEIGILLDSIEKRRRQTSDSLAAINQFILCIAEQIKQDPPPLKKDVLVK